MKASYLLLGCSCLLLLFVVVSLECVAESPGISYLVYGSVGDGYGGGVEGATVNCTVIGHGALEVESDANGFFVLNLGNIEGYIADVGDDLVINVTYGMDSILNVSREVNGSMPQDLGSFDFLGLPQVVSTIPPDMSVEVPRDITVKVLFNNIMNTSSVEGCFSIEPYESGTFSWIDNNMTLVYTFDSLLIKNTKYWVNISGSAKDIYDQTLDGDYDKVSEGSPTDDFSFSFITDPPPPVVILTVPSNGAVFVSYDTSIVIEFSAIMDRDSVEENITIVPNKFGSYSWSGGDSILTFTPYSYLYYEVNFMVVLSGDCMDIFGSTLDGDGDSVSEGSPIDDYIFSFGIRPRMAEESIFQHQMSLYKGYNMISIPLVPVDDSVEMVFESIIEDFVFLEELIDGVWISTDNTLDSVCIEKGYWIYVASDCELYILGTVPEYFEIELVPGWNLVGYPYMSSMNHTWYMNNYSGNYTIKFYNGSSQMWHTFDTEKIEFYRNSGINIGYELGNLTRGRGYFIYVDEPLSFTFGEEPEVIEEARAIDAVISIPEIILYPLFVLLAILLIIKIVQKIFRRAIVEH